MRRKPSGNIRAALTALPASRRPLPLAISAALASTMTIGTAPPAVAQHFPNPFPLASLDGSNGFRVDGVAAGDSSGSSVSGAGDVNGDGIDDLIVGAAGAEPNGIRSGSSYIVFGVDTADVGDFPATLALSGLDGSNGFRIDGVAADDQSGRSVSAAGDINGDGIDDLIIGALGADPNGIWSGSSYVVFGRDTTGTGNFPARISLSDLDGSDGFRLDGGAMYDYFGFAVSGAGDINGDGIGDLIIGALGAELNGGNSGSSYVVFGRNTARTGNFPAVMPLSDLDGSDGFRLDGASAGDYSGKSVSAAGDINNDGIDDLIIGAPGAETNGFWTGSSYVVFGRDTASTGNFPAVFVLSSLNGSNGFRLDGVAVFDESGQSVSGAGDINGDGIDDLVIGASRADPNGASSGSSFVVYGRDTASIGNFPAALNLSDLDGSDGFRIDGAAAEDRTGLSVSAAGDINGDGVADLAIGAPFASGNAAYSGSTYVVFGLDSVNVGNFPAVLPLSRLDDSNGFRFDGMEVFELSGSSVSGAGDINDDGIDDLIIGAPHANRYGRHSGSSYVVFGSDTLLPRHSKPNKQGSLLVYPLVASSSDGNDAVINMTNTRNQGTWVQCNIQVQPEGFPDPVREDFQIYFSPFQTIWWRLSQGYLPHHLHDQFGFPRFFIPPYPDFKGLLYCWAIDGLTQTEWAWNYLQGDAVVYGNGQAFQYNAIPHLAKRIIPDRILHLDDAEYTAGTSHIWFDGVAGGADFGSGEVGGTLTLASLDKDFNASLQIDFEVDYACWNRKKQRFDRHRQVHIFAQHDLTVDLKLDTPNIMSDAFMCAADTRLPEVRSRTPVWAVFQQHAGPVTWGANIWHDRSLVYLAPSVIVLPDDGSDLP